MKPLNRAERNSTFLRFLVLFLITIAFIITVVFFSIEVPFRESDELRQRVATMQKESKLSNSFNVFMKETMDELNKYDPRKESPSATNARVKNKIKKMKTLLEVTPNSENSIYDMIVQNLDDLNEAKMKLNILKAD